MRNLLRRKREERKIVIADGLALAAPQQLLINRELVAWSDVVNSGDSQLRQVLERRPRLPQPLLEGLGGSYSTDPAQGLATDPAGSLSRFAFQTIDRGTATEPRGFERKTVGQKLAAIPSLQQHPAARGNGINQRTIGPETGSGNRAIHSGRGSPGSSSRPVFISTPIASGYPGSLGEPIAGLPGIRAPEVDRVLHPAVKTCPGHAIWKRDFTGSTGLFSAVLKPAPLSAVKAFFNALKIFGIGYSWGGYESLCVHVRPEMSRTATSWRDEGPVFRFHVGLEDVDDLKADLDRAFSALAAAR